MPNDSELLELLVSQGIVDDERAAKVRAEAVTKNSSIERVLIDWSIIQPEEITLLSAYRYNLTPISLRHFTPDATLIESISPELLNRHKIVPLAKCGKTLTVAMCDPSNVVAIEDLTGQTGLDLVSVIAPESEIQGVLEQFARSESTQLQEIMQDVGDADVTVAKDASPDLDLEQMLEVAEDAPVIRIVNSILVEALRRNASDIHIEPQEKSIRLRYRVDGVLYEVPSPPKGLINAMCSRIKIMSNLDIAERRVPQDGRFKIRALDKDVDIRVSVLPTVHGEKIVMRTLDKGALPPGIAALGMETVALERFTHALQQPHGMIFVTGPTGSGKTTTLYSALRELNTTDVNIITVEDPVEYQIKGINQVQVHADVGLTFSNGLRSILRQDPDIVLIGEVRDFETASIAVQAALTGHLVLSTLHTNDAVGAIMRLKNMGIEPFLLASSLILAQAQRLHRKLCPACKRPIEIPAEVLRANRIDPDSLDLTNATFYEPKGCPKCHDIGYKSRGAIMEVLEFDEEIHSLIVSGAEAADIRHRAEEKGMRSLREVGLAKAIRGETSIEEILRVTSSH